MAGSAKPLTDIEYAECFNAFKSMSSEWMAIEEWLSKDFIGSMESNMDGIDKKLFDEIICNLRELSRCEGGRYFLFHPSGVFWIRKDRPTQGDAENAVSKSYHQ